MARLSTRHSNQQVISFIDFSEGLNLSINPELIGMNELAQAENFEYAYPTNFLKTRDGFQRIKELLIDVEVSHYAENHGCFYFAASQYLYKYDYKKVTNLGKLSGDKLPQFAEWDNKILVASGASLQSYDGSQLKDCGSPDTDLVFVRSGRVVISEVGQSTLIYSGIGDETNWAVGTDSDAVKLTVGYKDGSEIVSIIAMTSDIIVFKTHGNIFRVVSEYPTWDVYEITRTQSTYSKLSTIQAENNVYFLTYSGFMSLEAVQVYGNIQTSMEGFKVNKELIKNLDKEARMWYVRSKGQIWVRAGSASGRELWIFHIQQKVWTRFVTPYKVMSVISVNTHSDYVVMNKTLYKIGGHNDDGKPIKCYLKTKVLKSYNMYLVKRVQFDYFADNPVTGTVSIDDVVFNLGLSGSGISDIASTDNDIAFSDTDFVYADVKAMQEDMRVSYRVKKLNNVIMVNTGQLTLKELNIEVAEV